MRVAQPPHRSSSSFFFSRWRDGIGRASMVSAVDAPRCGESTSSPGASGTKQSDGVQSGCTPWMAALFSGPPLILVGRQLRPFSSSARAMRDVPSILQLGSSPCIGLERCHSLEAGPSGGLSPTRPQHPHWHLRAYSTSIIPLRPLRRRFGAVDLGHGPRYSFVLFLGWPPPSSPLYGAPPPPSGICRSPPVGLSPLPFGRVLPFRVASAALRLLASLLSEAAPTARSPAQWRSLLSSSRSARPSFLLLLLLLFCPRSALFSLPALRAFFLLLSSSSSSSSSVRAPRVLLLFALCASLSALRASFLLLLLLLLRPRSALLSLPALRAFLLSLLPPVGVCLDSRLALPHDGRRLGCRVVGLSQSRRSVTMGRVHLVSSASRSSHPARFRQSRSLRSSSFESLAHSCRHPSRGSDSQTTSTRHLPVRATREAERDSYR